MKPARAHASAISRFFGASRITRCSITSAAALLTVAVPQLDACYAFCNHPQSFFGPNMANSGTIAANCPADSIARGGSVVYELVEGLDHGS